MTTAIQRFRTDLVGLLKDYFDNKAEFKADYDDLQIVPTDISYTDKPKYPFISYKVTTSGDNSNDGALLSRKIVDSIDEGYEDIEETKTYQPKFICSLNCYSDNEEESQILTERLQEYFNFIGSYDLNSNNLVMVNIGQIQPRNLVLNMAYEYRHGFDIEVRTITSVRRTVETIDTYRIDREIKEGGFNND